MKLGVVSAIFDGWNYDAMIETASRIGFECVEVACWPQGKAERRYAGVSHVDSEHLTKEKASHIRSFAADHHLTLSSLAYYPNTLDPDLEKRKWIIEHLYSVIDASQTLGVGMVTTFIGRDQYKPIGENIDEAVEVWHPILSYAQEKGVKIAIENCPMLFGPDQWPGGQNLFTSPVVWNKLFQLLPFSNFGLNFDPSHFVWQQMDYVKAVHDFKDKLFHIHCKDIKLNRDRLAECGVLAYPLDYMTPKLPGHGDVDWGAFVSALTDVGYDGCACVEMEDRFYEGSRERIVDSLKLAYHYLRNFVI